MITLDPGPEELASAHLGRWIHVNGRRTATECFEQLRRGPTTEGETCTEPSLLECLALGCGSDPVRYSQEHSMTGAIRVAVPRGDRHIHGSRPTRTWMAQNGMAIPRREALVCRECVAADVLEGPMSWFRRIHHLVGVDWCPIHRTALEAVIAPDPFGGLPHAWLSAKATTPISSGLIPPESGFLPRFVEICCRLLVRTGPSDCQSLNNALTSRAAQMGIGANATRTRTLLSDHLLDIAGEDWLLRHVPHFAMKGRGLAFRAIDAVLDRRESAAPGETYAMALAALYGSAAEAIQVLDDASAMADA